MRILSNEWRAWWRPAGAGYIDDICYAGIFTFEFALELTKGCGPEKQVWYEDVEPPMLLEQEKS